MGSSPGWWAASVATYCTSRVVEHSKSKSTKPSPQGHGTPCRFRFSPFRKPALNHASFHFSLIAQFLGEDDSDDEAVRDLAQRTRRKVRRAELAGRSDDVSSDADEDFR